MLVIVYYDNNYYLIIIFNNNKNNIHIVFGMWYSVIRFTFHFKPFAEQVNTEALKNNGILFSFNFHSIVSISYATTKNIYTTIFKLNWKYRHLTYVLILNIFKNNKFKRNKWFYFKKSQKMTQLKKNEMFQWNQFSWIAW